MIRDNLPSHHRRNKYAFGQPEFVTVKVQGILVTCIHLPQSDCKGGESGRIKEMKRIWEKLEEEDLCKEVGTRHIFAGDLNSLTWEDQDEEEWERVADRRAAANLELDEAISLSKKMQELPKDSIGQSPVAKAELFFDELDKVKAQLVSSLEGLSIKPRAPLSKLISNLEFKKREKPKFDLTKLMKENGFKDLWEEVGEFGQSGSQATSR